MQILKSKSGQVVVEYILLIAAVVFIMLSVFQIISARVAGDCPGNSILCVFQRVYTAEGMLGGSFRFFTLRGGRERN